MPRTPATDVNAADTRTRARNKQLRERFPPRPVPASWPLTAQSLDDTVARLTSPPFVAAAPATQAGRRRGVVKLLRWLSELPGDTWQQRWLVSGADEHPGADWVRLPGHWLHSRGEAATCDSDNLTSGLLMLVCVDVIRPGLPWMLTRTHRYLATVMAQTRDPDGFGRLDQLAQAGHGGSRLDARIAATRTATILACKGGTIVEITVGDCVELVDTQRCRRASPRPSGRLARRG
jgi:hypothetical protein